jgi:hypothetical protein
MLSRAEVHRLVSLRNQLGVSDADHERVMSELEDEDKDRSDVPAAAWSPEKHLQLDTYAEALARHLERLKGAQSIADDALVRDLRRQYEVTPEEHAAVLDRILRRQDGVAAHLADVPGAIEWTAETVAKLSELRSPAARFAARVFRRKWARAAETLTQALGAAAGEAGQDGGLLSADGASRAAALAAAAANLSAGMAQRLSASATAAREQIGARPAMDGLLRSHLGSADPYVRAISIYLLQAMDAATDRDLAPLEEDEHQVVRQAASRRPGGTLLGGSVTATTLEKMIGLSPIGIFEDLEPEDLAELARAGTERWFVQNQPLCHQGERGDEAFVILDGEVSVLRPDGQVAYTEGPGSCIGELAVLDPAPREATVVASTVAVRALGLTGGSLRNAMAKSPAVSQDLIRMLARRLRRALPSTSTVPAP